MKTYLFCNAHLDPVWLWQWESGMMEGISTYRAASEFIDEYPDFVFNHNEALVYQWVEEHEPELFEKIQEQVAEGRWEIVGGWFLQPDCNMPSGESVFRQVLQGRLYFYDKFGKVPVTAVNFDSFGHARGLVQMLKKCGYKYYVNIRPGKNIYDFDSEDFIWRGYEGSEIIVHRSDKGYNSVYGKVKEELPRWIEQHKGQKNALYLWGVGNHGGGPSRKDLNDIARMKEAGMELVHAKPDEYFETIKDEKLPVVEKGLNPVMEGCYTSVIRIKQMHRLLENDLVMVEEMASHAAIAGLASYEKESIDYAWRDLLFSEFHDSLPGSCIAPVEEDIIRMLDHGLEITNKLKAKYFLALCAGQERLKDGDTVSIFVYNPHPFPYYQPVDVEFMLPRQLWHKDFSDPVVYCDGQRIPCQTAREASNFSMDWNKRVIFECELPPAGMSRFDVHFNVIEKRPSPRLKPDRNGDIRVETACGQVVINAHSGLLISYVVDGSEYVKPGTLAVDVYDDAVSPWGGDGVFNPQCPMGSFSPMPAGEAADFAGVQSSSLTPVLVTEEGEVYTVIEAYMQYHNSRMLIRYMVNKLTGVLEQELRIFFAEREKRLKLRVSLSLEETEYLGQTIFGREKLNNEMEECVSQYWQAVANREKALVIINDGVYGSNCKDGTVGISLLRSAGYGAGDMIWGSPYRDRMYHQRMEQGERRYRFMFLAGERSEVLGRADREAAMFNRKVYAQQFCPPGRGKIPRALVRIDKENVILSCFKRSERSADTYILRVFESQGQAVTVKIELPVSNLSFEAVLHPFEIKVYKLENGAVTETDMLEGAVPIG